MAAVVYTVRDAITACGVNNVTQFGGRTQAQRIASEVFDDDFESCRFKSNEELKEDLKSYAGLTVAQGRIHTHPGVRRNIRAFIQWAKDRYRRSEDPTVTPFPVAQAAMLIKREQAHIKLVQKSESVMKTASPGQLTTEAKWSDWREVFLNFLRSIPGQDGVPLSYVVRTNDVPDPTPRPNFIDEYVAMAPLVGDSFIADSKEVHTYLVKFLKNNPTAESKIQTHLAANNGRLDFQALVEHFEGSGIHSVDIVREDKILKTLDYLGEKRPQMWWTQFEIELNFAFTAYQKKENRVVHLEDMKLRILLGKIKADFLSNAKASINVALAAVPMTMTYTQAITTFRQMVHSKYPPDIIPNRPSRRIQGADTKRNGGGKKGKPSPNKRG